MTIVKLDPLFKEIHGKIGNLVFRRGPNGQTIVSWAPKKKRPKSRKAQKARKEQNARQKQLLEAAHDYARAAMADPKLQAQYERQARKKKQSAYRLAFGSYLKVYKRNEGKAE
jgi:hypothetical protein